MTSTGPRVGMRLGRYEVLEQIGAGGMGIVYRAYDGRLHREVAVKILPPGTVGDENARRRLRHEALSLSRINHPNIATVHDFDAEGGVEFLVSELIRGTNLDEMLTAGPLPEAEVVRLGVELADGLVAAHAQGIIHRDLKPANLRLTSDHHVKILDFGIATIQPFPDDVTLTSAVVDGPAGTLAYMAPEQLRGEAPDARTDIWAAGVVLFEMARGRRPFQARTASAMAAEILHASPDAGLEHAPLSAGLKYVIVKCLTKDPDERYQSATELRVDLRRLSAARPAGATGRRRWLRVAVTVALVAIVLAALTFASSYWRVHEPPPEATRWYERGMIALRDGAFYSAASMFGRSLSIDDDFALAHARLAEIWRELDEGNRAREELLLAVPPVGIRRSLTPFQERYLDAVYKTVTGDYEGALRQYQAIESTAPAGRRIEARIDMARALEKAGRADDALALYDNVTKQNREYASAFLRKGVILARKGQPQEALDSVAEALTLYRTANNLESVAVALHQRGLIQARQRQSADSQRSLQESLALARDTGNLLIQVRALTELSRQAGTQGDMALSERYAKEAADLARRHDAENLITRAAFAQGNAFLLKGDYARAETHFREGLALAQRFRTDDLAARMLFSLASTHVQQSRAREAIPEIEQALAFFEPRNSTDDILLCRLLLGRALRIRGELGRSLEVFRQARQAARSAGNAESERLAIQGIALVLEDAERLPEALAALREAHAVDPNATMNEAYDRASIAGLLCRLGRAEEGQAEYTAAGAMADKAGYEDLQRTVQVGLAELELSRGAWSDAKRRADRMLRDAPDYDRVTLKRILSQAAMGAGRHVDAMRAAQQAVTLAAQQDSVILRRRAELTLAEAELRAKAFQDALARALRVEAEFERAGQLESRWRALAIAAQAARGSGDAGRAVEYASSSSRVLGEFERRCGEAFAGYRSRKDVQRWVAELSSIASR